MFMRGPRCTCCLLKEEQHPLVNSTQASSRPGNSVHKTLRFQRSGILQVTPGPCSA